MALRHTLLAACLLTVAARAGAAEVAVSPEAVLAAGTDAGLCVHLGATDGRLEAGLAASGRLLVHGLALDDAATRSAREHLMAEGVYGVATVDRAASLRSLPYPDNVVNIVVADTGALGAATPAEKEFLRVVVPGGVTYMKRPGGGWTKVVKPRPAEMGTWTHPLGSASSNAVSKDALVGPVTTIRWLDGYAGYSANMAQAGLPSINEHTLVHDDAWSGNENGRRLRLNSLVCRDPYNGLPRWRQRIESAVSGMYVAGDLVLSTHAVADGKGDFLRAYDARTGKLARIYDQGGTLKEVAAVKSPAMGLAIGADTIYQAAGKSLHALDLKTGERRWTYAPEGIDAFFSPSLTPDGKKLCVVEHKGRGSGWRWPSVFVGAITALDPTTGKVLWRNTDVAGLSVAYTPVTNERLAFHPIWGIGSMTEGVPKGPERAKLPRDFGVIDVATGKLLWKKGPKDDAGAADFGINTGLVWGSALHLMHSTTQAVYDLDTGKLLQKINFDIVNQRCTRVKATENYMLSGFGTFLSRDGKYTDQNISRSACATGMTPANGLVFQTRNGCGCFAQVRAHASYASEPVAPPVPDAERLATAGGTTFTGGAVKPPADVAHQELKDREGKVTGTIRRPAFTAQPVRDAWVSNENFPFPETSPVPAADGRQLVAVVCENRLESRQDGKVAWSYVTEGRIVHEPLVHEGKVYFGARDGYVYCLDEKTGKLQWRFLAAAGRRKVVAYGALESAWPINGIALHEGAICASAGRHTELDGGIYLWGLAPATGEVKWRGHIHNNTAGTRFKLGEKRAGAKYVNYLTNGRLVSSEGRLRLVGGDPLVHGGGNKQPERNEPLAIDPRNPPR